jgi:hypothetical protein
MPIFAEAAADVSLVFIELGAAVVGPRLADPSPSVQIEEV